MRKIKSTDNFVVTSLPDADEILLHKNWSTTVVGEGGGGG